MSTSGIALAFLLAISCAAEERAPEQAQTQTQDENEVRQLRADNEALRRQLKEKADEAALRDDYIVQVTHSLNEVQDNLTEMTRKQQDLSRKYVSMVEERKQVSVSQRDDLMQNIQSLRNELAETAAALARARRKADDGGESKASKARIAGLVQLVDKLRAEVEIRTTEIELLHKTVANLQLDVRHRDKVIEEQKGTLAASNVVIQQQGRVIVEEALEKYRVWYRVDTYDRLRADHVIESRGLAWSLSTSKEFDRSKLKEKHRSALPDIRIDKPRARLSLVTIHADGSYEWDPVSRNETVFRILDPVSFWATGPYLVIGVK